MLFVENERASDSIENLSRLRHMLGRCLFPWSNRCHASFYEARCIRHGPDDGNGLVDNCFHKARRHARGHRDHDMIGREIIGDLTQYLFHCLRLYTQEHQMSLSYRLAVRQSRFDVELRLKLV